MKQLLTHAHTPEEVSLLEKMTYTIKIKAVAILKSCGLPNSFWGESIKYMVATDNVTGCTPNDGSTPWEKFKKAVPNADHLR